MLDRETLLNSTSGTGEDAPSADESADVPATLDDEVPVAAAPTKGLRRGLVAAAMLSIVALGGVTAVQLHQYVQHGAERDREQQYLQAARQSMLDLTTISASTVDDDVARVLERSTGSFRDQFDERSDDFVAVVQQANVQATGTITEAGIENADENSASVLVAATSKVTNSAGAQQESRVWRLRITLENDGQAILVSDVEFVP